MPRLSPSAWRSAWPSAMPTSSTVWCMVDMQIALGADGQIDTANGARSGRACDRRSRSPVATSARRRRRAPTLTVISVSLVLRVIVALRMIVGSEGVGNAPRLATQPMRANWPPLNAASGRPCDRSSGRSKTAALGSGFAPRSSCNTSGRPEDRMAQAASRKPGMRTTIS